MDGINAVEKNKDPEGQDKKTPDKREGMEPMLPFLVLFSFYK